GPVGGAAGPPRQRMVDQAGTASRAIRRLPGLRSVVRRIQIAVGTGFLAAALGGVTAAPVAAALLPWAQSGRSPRAVAAVHALVSRFWVYGVLPALWLLLSRLVKGLPPWRTAIASALTGEACYVTLDWMSDALADLPGLPLVWIPRLLTFALG